MDRYYIKICNSTNDTAKFFIESGVEIPFVVISEEQTRGRGQQGRKWISQKGGLYSSFVLKKIDSKRALIIGALAAYKTLISFLPVKIRFPNDILVGKRKIGGVLVEQTSGATIIGIGINVNQEAFPEEIKGIATSLFLETGAKKPVSEIADILICEVEDLERLDYEKIFQEYYKVVSLRGKCFLHLRGGREVACEIKDIDEELDLDTTAGFFNFNDIVWIEWIY
uniref:Biotin--[acetyl-CoA-carboxylase] ligase n=1 Tax=candidate division WOR-3 bacterium TaxID=2052148 RepID=A0A7C2K4J0_UNCW3